MTRTSGLGGATAATLVRPSPALLVVLLGLTSWMGIARLVRGQVMSLRTRPFVLAARTGYRKVRLIIAPTDFRVNERPLFRPGQPKWLPKLYDRIAKAMVEFKSPPAPSLLSFFMQ